jgi:hypothetical protein
MLGDVLITGGFPIIFLVVMQAVFAHQSYRCRLLDLIDNAETTV